MTGSVFVQILDQILAFMGGQVRIIDGAVPIGFSRRVRAYQAEGIPRLRIFERFLWLRLVGLGHLLRFHNWGSRLNARRFSTTGGGGSGAGVTAGVSTGIGTFLTCRANSAARCAFAASNAFRCAA